MPVNLGGYVGEHLRRHYNAGRKSKKRILTAKIDRRVDRGKELHQLVTDILDTTVPAHGGGSFDSYCIANPAQGTSNEQRIGNKIKAKYLRIRGYLKGTATAGIRLPDQIRVIIWQYKDTHNTIPALEDFMYGTDFNDPLQIEARQKVKILYDKVHYLCSSYYDGTHAMVADGAPFIKPFDIKIKGRSMNEIIEWGVSDTYPRNAPFISFWINDNANYIGIVAEAEFQFKDF